MATYLHFAPAVALAVAIGPQRIGWRLTLAGAACAVLPDADFLLYVLHIDAYSGTYGHRGFTHSIGFALLVGALGALLAGRDPLRSRWLTAVYLALCTASHWPMDGARHCLPWRPIPLQGVPLFGADRLAQELLWIGMPLLLLANAGQLLRWVGRYRAWHRRGLAAGAARRARAVDARGAALPEPGANGQPHISRRAQRQRRVSALHGLVARLRTQHRQAPAPW
jgi:inner membrane protein